MMKKLLKLAILLFLGIIFNTQSLFAQDDRLASMASRMKDGVIMHQGMLLQIKDGEMTGLSEPFTTPQGTKVMTDGTVIKPNGTRTKLREGYAVNTEGNVVLWKDDMFRTDAIQSHAQQTIGNTETVIVVPAGGKATVVDQRSYDQWMEQENIMQLKLDLMEQKNALMEQRISELEAQLKSGSKPDTRNIDAQLRRIESRLNTISAQESSLDR